MFSAYIVQVLKTPGKIMQSLQYQRGQKNQNSFLSFFCKGNFERIFLQMVQMFCPQKMSVTQSTWWPDAKASPWQPMHPQVLQYLSDVFLWGHHELALGPRSLASPEPVLFVWGIFSYYNSLFFSFSQQTLFKPLPSTKHSYKLLVHSYEQEEMLSSWDLCSTTGGGL